MQLKIKFGPLASFNTLDVSLYDQDICTLTIQCQKNIFSCFFLFPNKSLSGPSFSSLIQLLGAKLDCLGSNLWTTKWTTKSKLHYGTNNT